MVSTPGLFFRPPGFSPYMGREERRVQGLDYCHSDSIPSRTFLCFNPLSLATISAFQSTPLWHSIVGRARPIECFIYEGLRLLVSLCPCVLSSLFGKGAMFLPQKHNGSYIQHISAFTKWLLRHVRLISFVFLPGLKATRKNCRLAVLLKCSDDLFKYGI